MIHHVFANRSNIGDWLSAKGIQRALGSQGATEYFCDTPFVPVTLRRLSRLGPSDYVVIGGGGLFMDYFTPFWEGFLPIARRLNFVVWGAGYCDLKAEHTRGNTRLLQEIVRASRLCIVRDRLTWEHLDCCDLPPPVPCPSLIAVDPEPLGHGVLHVDNYTTVGAAAYERMDEICRAYAAETGRVYRQTNNRIEPPRPRMLEECLNRYRLSDVVISSALHGCIIAVAMGRPLVAVSGDYKIESFMEAAGLGDWALDAADVGRLPELLARLEDQVPRTEFVVRARAENLAVAEQVRRLIAEQPEGTSP